MASLLALLLGLLLVSPLSFSRSPQTNENSPLPINVVNKLREAWKNKSLGRYMGQRENDDRSCTDVNRWPNWESFPLKRCTYSSNGKDVQVIMLNPSRELLLKWVVASCTIKHRYEPANADVLFACADKLMSNIRDWSGSQFPVAGIVCEPAAYSFRDGLTVELKLNPLGQWAKEINTEFQQAALDGTFSVARFGRYARIANTTREQFANYERECLGRTPSPTEGEKFLAVIRRTYQDAWRRGNDSLTLETIGKYRNDLIAASLY